MFAETVNLLPNTVSSRGAGRIVSAVTTGATTVRNAGSLMAFPRRSGAAQNSNG